jgi:hypothetical protein
LITGREDYPARINGSGGTAKTRPSGQLSVKLGLHTRTQIAAWAGERDG